MRIGLLITVCLTLLAAAPPALAKSVPKQTERALYCGYNFLLEATELAKAGKSAASRKAKESGELNIKFAVARLHWEDFSDPEISRLKQTFEAQVLSDRQRARLKFMGSQCSLEAVMNA